MLGVDILRDRPFREYRLDVGAGAAQPTAQEFLGLLLDPASVVLTEVFARPARTEAESAGRADSDGRSTSRLAMGDQVRGFACVPCCATRDRRGRSTATSS